MPTRFWVERLEERNVLSANPLIPHPLEEPPIGETYVESDGYYPSLDSILEQQSQAVGGSGGLMPMAPFPLEETFFLHSLPGATKTIYLDFDGHTTVNTQWNVAHDAPTIVTPTYDFDGDLLNFSDAERLAIQQIWERVAEDFRPFNVNVTTQDPGVEALRNTSDPDDPEDPDDPVVFDDEWGIRVVIGGHENDWYDPEPAIDAGGVAHIGSFTSDIDDPCFVFAADAPMAFTFIAEASSHEVGHTLGLVHDGQFRFVRDVTDEDMDGMPDEDPPPTVRIWFDYYIGHGYFTNIGTSWSPIMGAGAGVLTQWSKVEYPNGTNDEMGEEPLQDDLEIITTGNGFGYRNDDHGDSLETSTSLVADSNGVFLDAEGIIERNTDVDYFSFVVEGLGELVTFDITPFVGGPNLDVLAEIRDSAGNVVATSNPLDDLYASFTDLPLLPGTYYLSVDGTGRPVTFIDPAIHPGPPDAMANTADPLDELDEDDVPIDTSDWGYTDYGSLGYYSITGSTRKELVVGVDFDIAGGSSPLNWTLHSGGSATLEDLIAETGMATPWDLTVTTTANAVTSPPLNDNVLPVHSLPLNQLGGYIGSQTETMTFEWSGLDASAVYHVYVFGSANTNATNLVTVTGGEWLAETQIYNFTQTTSLHNISLNGDDTPGGEELVTKALLVIADEQGRITINVDHEVGMTSAIAGLAISPTKVGSISGQKWNDVDGDGGQPEVGEEALPGWMIYLDMNNNGQLDFISTPELPVTQASPDVPQQITDGNTVKSEMNFAQGGPIADINVTIDIAHTAVGDLNVWLTSPSGTKVKLFDDIGAGANNIFVTIDDEAAGHLPIIPAVQPITGTYRPDLDSDPNPNVFLTLDAFDGEEAAGIWQLEVFDDQANDIGQINGWSIEVTIASSITYLEPFQITDENGNYTFTDLKAGQYFVREHIQDEQIEAGWRQSWAAPPVTVTTGADVTGVDFGNWIPVFVPGSITGQKWHDVDGNGTQDTGDEGLAGWQIYLDLNNNGVLDADTVPTTIEATDLPKAITDLATTTSVINVGDLGTIRDIEVTLDITHSFVGDLDAFLTSPSGRIVELFTGVGSQYNNLVNLTLDDDAAESIADIGADDNVPDVGYVGTWRPEGLLSEFLGDNAAGNWTLTIRDTTTADQGTLNSWSISITVGEPVTETDESGNYSFDNLPPGPYVVREVQQPGWTQTSAPPVLVDPQGNPYNVIVAAGGSAIASFGNKSAVALPGDFNRDGAVDMADWLMHRKTVNTAVANAYDGADGNGDGFITEADLETWEQNFGRSIDEFGDDAATAVAVAVPGSYHGNINEVTDEDWLSFSAQSGVEYEFATFHGGIHDSTITLYDTNGTTELAYDDDGGDGLEALLNWTAPASGTYYVVVAAYNSSYTGTYTLSIADVLGPGGGGESLLADGEGDSGDVAMALASPSNVMVDEPVSNVQSEIESAGDAYSSSRIAARFSQFHFMPAKSGELGTTVAAQLREESNDPAGEAAIVAWLNSLDDSDSKLGNDELAVSNPSDNDQGDGGDDVEYLDAIFDLIGA